jgi:hypothetical protein
MLLTLFLDPLGAVGEANFIIALGKLLFTVVLVLYLGLRSWSRHIGKQFDREPDEASKGKI